VKGNLMFSTELHYHNFLRILGTRKTRMRSFLYFVVGVVQVVACAQSPETTRNEEMKRFAKQVAERALDFSEGDIASLKDAQDDFTSDGWKSFLELEQIPNDTAAPEFSSEFTASADPVIIKDQAGAVGLGIPGEPEMASGSVSSLL
jgi:hypothetical protein